MRKIFGNKTVLLVALVALAAMLALAGCGNSGDEGDLSDNKSEGEDAKNETKLSGTVTTAGSTSVQPLSEELATAFMDKYTEIRVEVSGGGSSAGVKAAHTETADIGAASRKLKDSEKGVQAVTIAKDGISVAVHPSNPVEDITKEQVQKLFTGEIANWNELGGPDANIVVVIREEGSGTRGAFHEMAVGKDNSFTEDAIIQNSNGAVREAVSQDENAVGFVSLGAINDTIKTLKVEGAPPTLDAILSGDYPIARPLNYVLKEGKELSEVAQTYLDFVLSKEGQDIAKEMGYIPVK